MQSFFRFINYFWFEDCKGKYPLLNETLDDELLLDISHRNLLSILAMPLIVVFKLIIHHEVYRMNPNSLT